jgi:hypothetical protein
VCHQPFRMVVFMLVLVVIGPTWARAQEQAPPGQPAPRAEAEQPQAAVKPVVPELPVPPPITEVALVPMLPTTPVRRGAAGYNVQMVDASLLPRDKEGIWVLDFSFKPVRLRTIDLAGTGNGTSKGRKVIHYLYYRVINHTDKPRMFVPQFSLVTDTRQRLEDAVIPQALPIIQAREDASVPLLGAVDIMGMIPPSTKEGIDDAVFGVAVWEGVDPKADRFSIFVRGLSDGHQDVLPPPDGGKPIVRYKTLRIDFIRRGDERNLHEKEIQLNDPPYEWVYW